MHEFLNRLEWPSRAGLAICLCVITYLALTPVEHTVSGTFNDKVNHFLAFFVLASLADLSFRKSGLTWQKCLPLLLYGGAIECIQHYMPPREFSLLDFLANGIGLAGYAAFRAAAARLFPGIL